MIISDGKPTKEPVVSTAPDFVPELPGLKLAEPTCTLG